MQRIGPYLANALTAARILLTPVFVFLVWGASRIAASASGTSMPGACAVAVFAVVAASDVWDGRLARRFGSAGRAGMRFDHLADILFLLAAFSTYAALGVTPWWVPAAVAASFATYVADSGLATETKGFANVASHIGHLGGVANYGLVGILVCNTTGGLDVLPRGFLTALSGLVPVYSAAAVLARLLNRRKAARLTELGAK